MSILDDRAGLYSFFAGFLCFAVVLGWVLLKYEV